jgi:hypothetical protein
MSNLVILNIGKENNPFGAFSDAEFRRVMELAGRTFDLFDAKVETNVGEWDGNSEETFVVTFISSSAPDSISFYLKVSRFISSLIAYTTQDAISFAHQVCATWKGYLTYRHDWDGEKHPFDLEYFKFPSQG